MKKKWLLLIMAVLLIGAVGCTNPNTEESSISYETTYTVSLSSSSLQMDLFGEPIQLTASTQENFVETDGIVEWSSSAPEILKVENGVLTPLQNGEAIITAKWQGVQAECLVLVSSNSVPTLHVDCPELNFIYNESNPYAIDSWVVYKGETYRKDVDISYSIAAGGESIVTVDKNGTVTPIGVGETELILTAAFRNYSGIGMTKRIPISVFYDFEVAIDLASGENDILYRQAGDYEGTTFNNQVSLTKTISKMSENGLETLPNAQVEWKTSDSTIATVSSDGVVTASQAGNVAIWCEYIHQGYAHKSNEILFSVQPYYEAEVIDGKMALLDKSNPFNYLDATEVFGADYMGSLAGIYVKGKNVLTENGVDISSLDEGYYEISFVNDQGYAYTFHGAIATYVAIASDTTIGLLKLTDISGVQYYNLILPSIEDIHQLMQDGYKSLQVNYSYISSNVNEQVMLVAKHRSELQKTVLSTDNDYIRIDLNVILDRYDELDELSWTESAFTVSKATGQFEVQAFSFNKDGTENYEDFKLDRSTTIGSFNVENYIEKEGVVAQIGSKGTVSSDTKIFVRSTDALSKDTVRYWLNDGYDLYEVRYYLAYDTSKMSRTINAYTQEIEGKDAAKIGEDVALVANSWSTMTFRLDRYYAVGAGTSLLFAFDAYTADDGSAIEYELYIESIRAKKSGNGNYDIRMYAGWPSEMWTSEVTTRGVSEYAKDINGKTANFYFSFNQVNYQWGCNISLFTGLNVTVEQLKSMKEAGYTVLDFDIYAKTSIGSAISFRLNPEGKDVYNELHKYSLTSGEWTTISINLDLLIEYYDKMNGCKGGFAFGKVMTNNLSTAGVESILYEFGVGEISPR